MPFEMYEIRQLRPRDITTLRDPYHKSVYDFWYTNWSRLHSEIGGPLPVLSDSFTRQDEVLSLFRGHSPIAIVCHRFADLTLPQFFQDSYFQSWRPAAIEKLKKLGTLGVLGSQIVIDTENKTVGDLKTKYLISAISLYHLLGSDPDFILGMMRIDKGMEKVFYDMGAMSLDSEPGHYYSKSYDFVAFSPKTKPIHIPTPYRLAAVELYKRAEIAPVNCLKQIRSSNYEKIKYDAA